MLGFYGFEPRNLQNYSRVFNPEIIEAGRGAYNQGMAQFVPFNQQKLDELRAARAAQLANKPQQSNAFLANIPVGSDAWIGENMTVYRNPYADRNDLYSVRGINKNENMGSFTVDAFGNPVDRKIETMSKGEFDLYNRLMAKMRGLNNG